MISLPDIDFLQVRDGYLQILDYKPDARKEKHAHVQLTIYALALARRANLPLKNFKCAWFDEKDYFEFFPLKGVYCPKARPGDSQAFTLWRDGCSALSGGGFTGGCGLLRGRNAHSQQPMKKAAA